jgi:hypothetical protein
MIICTGALAMTMRPPEDPTDASGVVATADALDGASPPAEPVCLFGGLLNCSFQRLWYAALMGRLCGSVVDPPS